MIYLIAVLIVSVLYYVYSILRAKITYTQGVLSHYEDIISDYQKENKKLESMAMDAINCDEVRKLQADAMVLKEKYEALIIQYNDLRKAYNQNIFKSN